MHIISFPPYTIEVHESLTSSSDRALELEGQAKMVVVALEQTNGRGRSGRIWESTLGNLHATVIVADDFDSYMSLKIAAAIIMTIEELSDSLVQYKWPNDIMLNGSKVSGVLPETTPRGGIVGFGVNIANSPVGRSHINAHCKTQVGVLPFLQGILKNITVQEGIATQYGLEALHAFLTRRLYGLDREVTINFGDGTQAQGLAIGLTPDFNLILQQQHGQTVIKFGEVM